MKLSKGRIRHLHNTKQQSRRNYAKTKEAFKRHNLSHKNKTPVNLRSLTLLWMAACHASSRRAER